MGQPHISFDVRTLRCLDSITTMFESIESLVIYINWSKQVKSHVKYVHRRNVNISKFYRL